MRNEISQALGVLLHLLTMPAGLVEGSSPCIVQNVEGVGALCTVRGVISERYSTLSIEVDQTTAVGLVGTRFGVFAEVVSVSHDGNSRAKVFVSVAKGSSYFSFNSFSGSSPSPLHFFCNNQVVAHALIINVLASEPTDITLNLTFAPITVEGQNDLVQRLPTSTRDAWIASFMVPQSMVNEGRANFMFKVQRSDPQAEPQRMGIVYTFPVHGNSCLKELLGENATAWSGCFSVAALTSCLDARLSMGYGTADPEMIKLTISEKAGLPLSVWSKPALSKGVWLVVFKLDSTADWKEMSAELEQVESASFLQILLMMTVVPILAVLCLVCANQRTKIVWNSLYNHEYYRSGEEVRSFMCRRTCRTCKELLLIDKAFRDFLGRRLTSAFDGRSYAALLLGAFSSLFIAAIQKAVGDWQETQKSGSRDICHFNFECYHQWYSDFPANNVLSHLPYFCCGVIVFIVVLHSDYRALSKKCSRELDLRVFYALALSEALEGGGSLIYHTCPQKISFQYDSALMFAIALLSILALADVDEGSADSVTPTAFIVVLLVPAWLISFIGTWFDLQVFDDSYWYVIYSVFVILWAFTLLWYASKLFPNSREGTHRVSRVCYATMRVFAGSFMALMLVEPGLRVKFGGMSRVLLAFCLVMMVFICLRQIIANDAGSLSNAAERGVLYLTFRAPVKFGLLVAFLVVTYFALLFYKKTPYKSGGQAWESRNKNQACTLAGFFDAHDTWHMLSAIALALWTLVLLEIRLRIWKKQTTTAVAYELEEPES